MNLSQLKSVSCSTRALLAALLVVSCGGSSSPTPSNLCASVTCTAPDLCHVAGTCASSTGVCSTPTAKACSSAGQSCDVTDGVCKSLALCAGVTCSAADLCHLAGACQSSTGVCSAQTAKTCSASGQTCDPADGVCKASDLCAGVTCSATDLCHVAGACQSSTGVCGAQTAKACSVSGQTCDPVDGVCKAPDLCSGVACTGSTLCDPADGTCKPVVLRLQLSKALALAPLSGLAIDAAGAAYVCGGVNPPRKTFDNISVTSQGGISEGDAFLARYDPTSKAAVWARAYGDSSDQAALGVAVTGDATVAMVGNFNGRMIFGADTLTQSGSAIDFLAAVDAATGSGLWARQFNDGQNGSLKAIAANPRLNQIAVCGLTDQAATDLVPGATFGGGTSDVVLGMFDSSGRLLWSAQYGGANDEECDALAIDDHGDLYATGKFNGATLVLGSKSLTGPGSANRSAVWVAKLNGGTGAVLAAAAFGNSPTGKATPVSLAVDATGKVVLGGNFSIALPFGATTLTSAGSTDVFVARLDPAATAAFAPLWAVRLGSSGADALRSVAVSSLGDVLVSGLFFKSTTGAAALTSTSATASNAFLLELEAGSGATDAAKGFGDATSAGSSNTETCDAVAVNRQGAGAAKDLPVFGGNFQGTVDFGAPNGAIVTDDPLVAEGFVIFGTLGK